MPFTEDDKKRLAARIDGVLATKPPEDDLSEFVRSKMWSKLNEDWDRSKHRAGLTLDERVVLDENHANWRWHLYHVDPEVWRFLTFCHVDEYEPLTDEEIIRDYPEYAIEQGLINDDPAKRLKIAVGRSLMLRAKRGPDRMVIILDITGRGKVKVEKYIDDEDRWTAAAYIDPDDLYEFPEEGAEAEAAAEARWGDTPAQGDPDDQEGE